MGTVVSGRDPVPPVLQAPRDGIGVNILGDIWYEQKDGAEHYREPDWSKLYAVPNLKLHLYGKHHARPGRKMGHFTVIGEDSAKVLETALAARAAIGIRDE